MKPTMSFQDWCIQNHAYLMLHFYCEGKNPVPADEIGFSSGKRVRFRCHICGLSWQRTLNYITNHPLVQTCPFCEHRKPSPFYNLATEYPELKEEWDIGNAQKAMSGRRLFVPAPIPTTASAPPAHDGSDASRLTTHRLKVTTTRKMDTAGETRAWPAIRAMAKAASAV